MVRLTEGKHMICSGFLLICDSFLQLSSIPPLLPLNHCSWSYLFLFATFFFSLPVFSSFPLISTTSRHLFSCFSPPIIFHSPPQPLFSSFSLFLYDLPPTFLSTFHQFPTRSSSRLLILLSLSLCSASSLRYGRADSGPTAVTSQRAAPPYELFPLRVQHVGASPARRSLVFRFWIWHFQQLYFYARGYYFEIIRSLELTLQLARKSVWIYTFFFFFYFAVPHYLLSFLFYLQLFSLPISQSLYPPITT